MDDIVRQAIAKWPNVPDCYGWLGLDARGNWYMRDDRVQAQGAFNSGNPAAKGSRLLHEKLVDFIQRNYEHDEQGCWFFQNGPQKVYVELEATPLIFRLDDALCATAHTGQVARVSSCILDEQGWVYLDTDLGLGLVHTQDVGLAAEAIEQKSWPTREIARMELPARFSYVTSPAATAPQPPAERP
jgi:hypothetical protein